LWLIAFSLGVAITGTSKAQNYDYFAFRVCNTSGRTAYVATMSRVAPGSPTWRIVGWYNVAPGCLDIGAYPKGFFYFRAESDGGVVWAGPTYSKPACVVNPGPFERYFTGDYVCGPNETAQLFNEAFIDVNIGLYSVDLN
jgi:hypothetical protein